MVGSWPYSLVPGHSVLKPSRWPEICLKEYCVPAVKVFPKPLDPLAPAVSMVLPAGSPLYWPSFHAAIRATEAVTAPGAAASV